MRAGAAAIAGTCLVLASGCAVDRLDRDQAAMVAVGKADGLIDRGLPANCTRVTEPRADSSWGTIDEPAWTEKSGRCAARSRPGLLVFHRIGGRWRLVTTGPGFGHFRCPVRGVPAGVATGLLLC